MTFIFQEVVQKLRINPILKNFVQVIYFTCLVQKLRINPILKNANLNAFICSGVQKLRINPILKNSSSCHLLLEQRAKTTNKSNP